MKTDLLYNDIKTYLLNESTNQFWHYSNQPDEDQDDDLHKEHECQQMHKENIFFSNLKSFIFFTMTDNNN